MELARYVVEAVLLEGRSYREVARAYGVSKSWAGKLVARYRAGGEQALQPRSRAAHRIPHRTPPELEDEIVALRKELVDLGVDAGAATIAYHLGLRHEHVPSISTIWRVLSRRGFVTPQPHKRPRSSWNRFEAALPNECWQSDVTHGSLADGVEVEICNFLDDHSRVCLASRVVAVATATNALQTFREAGARWGFPAALLTDNGCVYTTWHRGGPNVMQSELLALGIDYRHSRPYHPQTCGKVERFHQTLKGFLEHQPKATSISELQDQVDRFVAYYNEVRPHRSVGRRPPLEVFRSRDKARPSGPKLVPGAGVRVRRDRIDKSGRITLRHRTRLHHIGVGKAHRGKRVIVLLGRAGHQGAVTNGELLRRLTLDPSRDYQPHGRARAAPMRRHIRPRCTDTSHQSPRQESNLRHAV
jgi:transposase InsO family protein